MSADCRWFIELEDAESILQWQRRGILTNAQVWDDLETVYDMNVDYGRLGIPTERDPESQHKLVLTHFLRSNKSRRCVIDSTVPQELANLPDTPYMQYQWNREYCHRLYLWLKNHCTRISLVSDNFDIDMIKTWKFEPQKDALTVYKIIGERLAA